MGYYSYFNYYRIYRLLSCFTVNCKFILSSCFNAEAKENANFVCAMEDMLEVCHRVRAEDEVLVCMDETGKQQVKETRILLPSKAGAPEKFDYEYERNGVGNLFMLSAPLEGCGRA